MHHLSEEYRTIYVPIHLPSITVTTPISTHITHSVVMSLWRTTSMSGCIGCCERYSCTVIRSLLRLPEAVGIVVSVDFHEH